MKLFQQCLLLQLIANGFSVSVDFQLDSRKITKYDNLVLLFVTFPIRIVFSGVVREGHKGHVSPHGRACKQTYS